MESPVEDDSDDNDDDYEGNELNDQPPLPIDAIAVNHYLTDDMYSGRYSKDVYHRVQSQDNLSVRLSLQSELIFYCSHYLMPRLLEILSSDLNQGFFIWIAGSLMKFSGLGS